jgi:hypothetical protein
LRNLFICIMYIINVTYKIYIQFRSIHLILNSAQLFEILTKIFKNTLLRVINGVKCLQEILYLTLNKFGNIFLLS